jgi:hypothetical protein
MYQGRYPVCSILVGGHVKFDFCWVPGKFDLNWDPESSISAGDQRPVLKSNSAPELAMPYLSHLVCARRNKNVSITERSKSTIYGKCSSSGTRGQLS